MKECWKSGQLSSQDKECVEYFHRKPIFDRILQGFRDKYMSYGSFSGTVTVRNLSAEEREDLEGFFQQNFHGQKSVSVSAARFEKALKSSRFDEISPKKLLEMYFGEEIFWKKEQKKEEALVWQNILQESQQDYAGTPAEGWICELQGQETESKTGMLTYLLKRYKEMGKDREEMKKLLHLAADIINRFPYRQGKQEYLAVFAAMLTGNPHAFDEGTKDGQLLYLLAEWDEKERGTQIEKSEIFPALQKQRQYFAVGILRDDISNYAMVSGIRVWKKDGGLHEGIEGFFREGDMVQVPLNVIAGWERVSCPEGTVYIVENPSVYALLCGKWKEKKACMCMNGQPRLSAVLLLDLFAKAGVKVFYAGDFDPEGILIAQKIKQYYQGEFAYWHMTEQIYKKSRSDEQISEKRLKILDKITDEALQETVQAIKRSRMAGYQENVWEIYLQ